MAQYEKAIEVRKTSMVKFLNDEEAVSEAMQIKGILEEFQEEKEKIDVLKLSLSEPRNKKTVKKRREEKENIRRRSERIAIISSVKDSVSYKETDVYEGKRSYADDPDWLQLDDEYDDESPRKRRRRSSSSPPSQWQKIVVRDLPVGVTYNVFGEIPGYPVGSLFTGRFESCRVGVHRSVVAGIHHSGEGAYSISVNTSYDENEDHGWYIWYCASGGRDLKTKNLRTACQTKDQTVNRGILGMRQSLAEGREVRVIRGPGSAYPPQEPGFKYRYDGLYQIVEEEKMRGSSGLLVYRFRLVRLENQEPLPFTLKEEDMPPQDEA